MELKTRRLLAMMGLAGIWGCGGGGGGGRHSSTVVLDPNGDTVTFAAFQNGSGAWVPLTADGSGQYSAKVSDPAGRYGIAAYDSVSKVLWIWQATTGEVSHLTLLSPASSPGSMSITGTVSGIPVGPDDLNIWAVDNHDDVSGNTSYGFSTTSTQPWDAVAILGNLGTPISSAVRRNLDTSATTQNFDVTTNEFQSVSTFSIAVTPPVSTSRVTGVQFNTANGTFADVGSGIGGSVSFAAPAPSERADGDFYDTETSISNNGGDLSASTDVLLIDPANQSITTPNLPSALAVSMTAGTNPLFQAIWTPDSTAKIFSFELTTADDQSRYQVYTTRGWLGGASSKSYTTPDLSQVSGWNSGFALSTSLMPWNYQGTATPLSTADYFNPNAPIPDGTSFTNWNQVETSPRFPTRKVAVSKLRLFRKHPRLVR